jgi:hypothetical protein
MKCDIWTSEQPYEELGTQHAKLKPIDRDDVIFISSRPGSGGSMLWSIFRRLRGFTSYYRPLHDKRWVASESLRPLQTKMDWMLCDTRREYDQMSVRKPCFNPDWARRQLFMDAEHSNPDLAHYIAALIDGACGRPVLYCNDIDFRLPWLRRHFPRATIVHLYRNPRDQWMSCMKDPSSVSRRTTMTDFATLDQADLLAWAEDLQDRFPILKKLEHPYQLSYTLWKLSYLYGSAHAHFSLRYEDLQQGPKSTLPEWLVRLRCRTFRLEEVATTVQQPRSGRWRQVDNDGWFRDQETRCENLLAEFFSIREPNAVAHAA